ncbi:helix-turn-helix transcriptional regulator [Enterobacter cloacae]|nr:helix-turn-helix transcriptional regulator [Enterobacter cloacae]
MSTQYYLKTLNQLRPVLVGFRKANGLTQREMSERLGGTQQTYARLEINPTTANIERLFRVFSLLGGESVLSSKESLPDSKPDFITKQQDAALPARREKWGCGFLYDFGIYESNENTKAINVGKSIREIFYQTAFLCSKH